MDDKHRMTEKNWLAPFIKASTLSSQEELADRLGVSRATINRLANDHSKLKLDRAREIAPYLGVPAEQLMLNRPPMTSNGDYQHVSIEEWDPERHEFAAEEARAYSRENYQPSVVGALPELDVHVGAGQGSVGEILALPLGRETYSGHKIVAEWLFPDGFLRNEMHVSPAHTLVMPVVGDSMMPAYMPGDRVLVDLTQNRMTTDTVYVISDGMSDPQIKRLQRVMFTDPAMVNIISDNPALGPQTVELSQLVIIGRVCGHIARK